MSKVAQCNIGSTAGLVLLVAVILAVSIQRSPGQELAPPDMVLILCRDGGAPSVWERAEVFALARTLSLSDKVTRV